MIKKNIRIGIFGSGNIGTDLLIKISKSSFLECAFIIGRREDSPGILLASEMGIKTYIGGIESIKNALDEFPIDWLADVSSAQVHESLIRELGDQNSLRVMDFTPSKLSESFVPAIDSLDKTVGLDIGLISCGAQSAIPMIGLLAREFSFKRIELVSSLASLSVGPATRKNIDEYIEKTEAAIAKYSNCKDVKAILIINPATPPINMAVSLFIEFSDPTITMEKINSLILSELGYLESFIPNFKLVGEVTNRGDEFLISYQVTGNGDYLPKYAGNLDVLTHAAIRMWQGI